MTLTMLMMAMAEAVMEVVVVVMTLPHLFMNFSINLLTCVATSSGLLLYLLMNLVVSYKLMSVPVKNSISHRTLIHLAGAVTTLGKPWNVLSAQNW